MVSLAVELCGVPLQNPVMPASGTFGFGYEFADLFDLNELGALVCKGVTAEPRFGNPQPRIAETTSGMLNAVGLQNPGLEAVIADELPRLAACFQQPIIANVCGFSVAEYRDNCARIDRETAAAIIELNISCPNVSHGGMSFGVDCGAAAEVTAAVKEVTAKPVFVKLSPNVSDIGAIARACAAAGADGISLINTLSAMRIDLAKRRPLLGNGRGGLSGPAVLPVALRMVYDVYEAVDLPIIGGGGVATAADVLEMMLAGATAVQIGAANLVDPCRCRDIIRELPAVMQKYGVENLADIIGGAH